MADLFRELLGKSRDDLEQEYDRRAQSTEVGLSFIREELARRDMQEHTDRIERLTGRVYRLTWAIAVLTLVNAVAVVWMIFGT